MTIEETKDVVIGDKRYRIGRVSSDVGSYLLFQVIASIRAEMAKHTGDEPEQAEPESEKSEKEKRKEVENATRGMIQNMLMSLDQEPFSRIQKHALSVCGQYTAIGEVETILPLVMATGKIAIPSLKYDIQTVVALTSESLFFNLSPFFSNGGFQAILN